MRNIYKSGLAILTLLVFLAVILSGCSAEMPKDHVDEAGRERSGYFDDRQEEADTGNGNELPSVGRKIIYTTSLEIETVEYDKSIDALENLVKEYDGFIQSSRIERQSQTSRGFSLRRAYYTLRIPSESREDFIRASGDVGVIILNETEGDDVTDRFYDTQARIQTLEVQENRLVELLSEAENLSDILDIEDRLSHVRYEIESLTGILDKLSSLVDMSTVYVEIYEVKALTEPDPDSFLEQVVATFNSSIKALVTTLRYIALGIVAIAPFLVALAVFIILLVVIIKSCKKRRRKKNE